MNTIPIYQSYPMVNEYLDHDNLMIPLNRLDKKTLESLKNIQQIDSDILMHYERIYNEEISEDLIAKCLKTISILKEQSEKLPNITYIEISSSIKAQERLFVALSCFCKNLVTLCLDQIRFDQGKIPSLDCFCSLKNLAISSSNYTTTAKNFFPASLEELKISWCDLLLNGPDLRNALSLKILNISYCAALESSPKNLASKVHTLIFSTCPNLQDLPNLKDSPELTFLTLDNCPNCSFVENPSNSLKRISFSNGKAKQLKEVNFPNLDELCIKRFADLTIFPKVFSNQIKKIEISSCLSLIKIPKLKDFPNLAQLDISESFDIPKKEPLRKSY